MTSLNLWQVIIPKATTNLVSNPSFEVGTTGYTAVAAGTLSQSSEQQAIGLYSGKYVPTSNTGDGLYYALTLTANTPYTFSISVFGADDVPYMIYLYDATGTAILGSPVAFTGDGTWRRQVVTAETGANTSSRIYIIKDGSASTDAFYIDAVQVEGKGYATTFCDGDQDGCLWIAGAGTSTSSRDAQSTAGGKVVFIEEEKYFRAGVNTGTGMPPAQIIDTLPAQSDGGDYQRTLFRPRQFQLTGSIEGSSKSDYHAKRKNTTQIFNPHGVTPPQPRSLRYRLEGNSVELRADYETGLQKQQPAINNNEKLSIGFKAQDPFWRAVMGVASGDNGAVGIEGQGAVELTAQDTVTNADYILQQDADGQWAAMGSGLSMPATAEPDAQVYSAAMGKEGKIYITGQFLNIGGVAANRVAVWDGTTWSALGTGLNGTGLCVKVGNDGIVYVGGDFLLAGGVANTRRIAKWDPATSTWSAMGTGANNGVWDIILDPDSGDIYAGGQFSSMGGVANTQGFAKWNGSAWSSLVVGGRTNVVNMARHTNGNIYLSGFLTIEKWDGAALTTISGTGITGGSSNLCGIAVDSNENVYITSDFTAINGVTANGVAKYNGSVWSEVESIGITGGDEGYDISMRPDDSFYISGNFSSVGGVTNTQGIALWNIETSTWSALGTGLNSAGAWVSLSPNGTLLVPGWFTSAGGVSNTQYLALWNGATWLSVLGDPVRTIIQATDAKIYIGGGFINAGGVANADKVAYWDPENETWNALSTGANGMVYSIAEAPNGDIYIAGSFSLAGGVANTIGIAYWDISASVWLPLSTGINGTVLSLAFAPNGDLYIGGLFLDAGGVANTQNLAMWDGSAFNALSDEPNDAVNDLVFNSDGTLWLGGSFVKIGSTTYDYIASYSPATNIFSVLETGTNGFINDLTFGPSGNLYLVGAFTQAGSQDANYISYWNGTQFFPLGSGFNEPAFSVGVDNTGRIYGGGVFTVAGGVVLPDKAAIWTGSVWTSLDIDLPGNAAIWAISTTATGVFIGFDTSGSATASGITSLTYNGDTYGYPILTATGPGQLYQLSNLTTEHNIYFDILLEDGETVSLDLRPGYKTFTSTFRGAVDDSILEGSDVESFFLLPGTNNISILIDDASASGFMLWNERFMSFDSVVYLPIVS